MYLDFEDYRPDIQPVGRALTRLEVVLLSIIFHLVVILIMVLGPRLYPNLFREDPNLARARALLLQQQQRAQQPRFVFVQPRRDLTAPKPPDRADASDKDRMARSPERAPIPTNPLPFSRGNSPERVEAERRQTPRGEGPAPNATAGQQAQARPPDQLPDSQAALTVPKPPAPDNGANGRSVAGGGALGEALKNLGRYVQRDQFDNPGGLGQPGATIQFDTKGVEFGPWLRRFVAQVKRNWFVPYAAMTMKGHVVITFNVHKDGSITDLTVIGPCPIDAFNNAAFGALVSSNPTYPLPPEYPSEKAFFTVTFYYNEPPG
jgi:TonB family protein